MKKIVVSAIIVMLSIAGAMADDDAGNYSGGWDNSTSYGTNFSLWSFSQVGGYWAPQFSTDAELSDFGDISSSDRVLALNFGVGYVNANRNIDTWGDGYTFTIDLATQWRNGNRGIDFQDSSDNLLWNFNISDLGYGDTGWNYQGDMVLSISAVQNGANLDITVAGSSAGSSWNATTNYIASGTLDEFSLYAGDTGGDNNNALLANNMGVIPEPATFGLLVIGVGLMSLRKRRA